MAFPSSVTGFARATFPQGKAFIAASAAYSKPEYLSFFTANKILVYLQKRTKIPGY